MTIFSNNPVRIFGIAFAALLVLAIPFAFASQAHAADIDGGETWGDYYSSDTGYSGDTWGDYYPSDSGYAGDTWGDYYPSDSGFSGGGFGGSGFSGGWGFGGSGSGGGSMRQAQSLSNTNTNINENYCTNGSCNTAVNAPTNIVTNYPPAQNVVYAQPSYPIYPPVYTQPAYYPAQRQVAYNNTPYVTLAAVPYTGLELGPVGTALYWGFLVLWCLLAAYLIVVKKIQNKIAAWFTGNATQNSASQKSSDLPSSGALRATPAGQTFVKHNSAPLFSGIDSFVLSQINRA